jgi:hypothetical protein
VGEDRTAPGSLPDELGKPPWDSDRHNDMYVNKTWKSIGNQRLLETLEGKLATRIFWQYLWT